MIIMADAKLVGNNLKRYSGEKIKINRFISGKFDSGFVAFVADTFKLASGTIIAQALIILAFPMVTRLYSPDAFGIAALFASITGTIGSIVCLRYQMAIMLPKSDEEAANLFAVSLIFAAALSFLSLPALLLGEQIILKTLNEPRLGQYFWLMPLAIFANGVFQAFVNWNSRTRHFGRISTANIANSIGTVSTQVGSGLAGYVNGGSLIVANTLGIFVSAVILACQTWRDYRSQLQKSLNWNIMIAGIRRYKNFPLYDTWGILLNTFSGQLPTFILASFFSSKIVGYYSVANMVLLLPMNLIGSSIFQVFFSHASKARLEGNLAAIVEQTVFYLEIIAIYPIVMMSIIGKEIFAIVLGGPWAEAGVYAQILAVWVFLMFITSPISALFSILERQRLGVLVNAIVILARIGALILGGILNAPRISLILFSFTGVVFYGGSLYWLLSKSNVSFLGLIIKSRIYYLYAFAIGIILIFLKLSVQLTPLKLITIGLLFGMLYYIYIFKNLSIRLSD